MIRFTSPQMLFGLFAMVIPVIIHLFNLRRYKKIYFSNVSRLAVVEQETRQRSRIRSLLILATRMLMITFVVIAFAHPTIVDNHKQTAGQTSPVCIYIDNSISMSNSSERGSVINDAMEKARAIVAAFSPETEFMIISNEMSGQQFRWISRDQALSQIEETAVCPRAQTLSSVVERCKTFLRQSHHTTAQLYVLSDFQLPFCDIDECSYDSLLSVTLIPTANTSAGNIYLDTLVLNAPIFRTGSTVTVSTSITNDNDAPADDLQLRLYVNNRLRAMTSVDVPEHESTTADLSFTLDEATIANGRVEITDATITFDDTLFFSITPKTQATVTLLDNSEANPQLKKLFATDSSILFTTATEHNLNMDHSAMPDLLIVNNQRSISTGIGAYVEQVVASGRTALIIPPIDADLQSYNTLLAKLNAPLLTTLKTNSQHVAHFNNESSLYTGVFTRKQADLELPTAEKHFATANERTTSREDLMTFADGDAFLIHSMHTLSHADSLHNAGHTYLLTSPLEREYSDFTAQALFVPTVYNMALSSNIAVAPYYTLGSSNACPLVFDYSSEHARLACLDEGIELIPDIRHSTTATVLLQHGAIATAGNYTLYNMYARARKEGLSFNHSRAESVMQFAEESQIKALISNNNLRNFTLMRSAGNDLTSVIHRQQSGKGLWQWCIVIVLALLAAETLLIRLPSKRARKDSQSHSAASSHQH